MKTKLFSRISLLIGTVLLSAVVGLSQTSVIITPDGAIVIQNGVSKPFMLRLKGKSVIPQKTEKPAFIVDDEVLQLVFPTVADVGADAAKDGEEAILRKHMVWESDYLGDEIFKKKLNVVSEKVMVGDRVALFWGFDRPSYNEENKADYFLTTIVGTNIVALQNPVPIDGTKEASKKFLTAILATIKVSDKEFDVMKISEQLRKGIEP